MATSSSSSRKIPIPIVLFCLFLAFLKLWLISQDEIIARDIPDQQLWFVKEALELMNFNWLGAYNSTTLSHSPIYPLWIVLVNQLGFPLRIGTECLLFFSAFFFSASLFKNGLPAWLSCLVYFLIVFNPINLLINREILSASIYFSVYLLLLSLMLRLLNTHTEKESLIQCISLGVITALLFQLLEDQTLLLSTIVIFFIVFFVTRIRSQQNFKKHSKFYTLLVGLIIFPTLLLSFLIRAINFHYYDAFSVTFSTNKSAPEQLPLIKWFDFLIKPLPITPQRDDPKQVSTDVMQSFDQAAKRRADKTRPFPRAKINGWAYSEKSPIVRIEIRDAMTLASTQTFIDRMDVFNYFKNENKQVISPQTGFELEFPGGMEISQLTLALVRQDGSTSIFPLNQKGNLTEPRYSIDVLDFPVAPSSLPWKLQKYLGEYFGITQITLLVVFLGGIILLSVKRCLNINDPLFAGTLLILLIQLFYLATMFFQNNLSASTFLEPLIRAYPISLLLPSLAALVAFQAIQENKSKA